MGQSHFGRIIFDMVGADGSDNWDSDTDEQMRGQWDGARRFVLHDIGRDLLLLFFVISHDFFRNFLFAVNLSLDRYPYEWGVFQVFGALIFLWLLLVDLNRWRYYK